MLITSGHKTYEVNRHDFTPAIDRGILPELEWKEGISDNNQYVNVKVDDELSDIVAIECFSGYVYKRK